MAVYLFVAILQTVQHLVQQQLLAMGIMIFILQSMIQTEIFYGLEKQAA
jgi:hypothetical protein